MADSKTLAELAVDVQVANDKLLDANRQASEANRYQTDCLNAVNEAQGAFDARLAQVRKDAVVGTDWNRPTGMHSE